MGHDVVPPGAFQLFLWPLTDQEVKLKKTIGLNEEIEFGNSAQRGNDADWAQA